MSAREAPLECESMTLQQYPSPRRNLKAAGALFGLGMIAGMVGLVAAEHFGLVDSSSPLAVSSFVPTGLSVTRTRTATNLGPAPAGVAQNQRAPRIRTDLQMMQNGPEDGAEPKTQSSCNRRNALLKAAAAAATLGGMSLPALAATTTQVKMGSDNGQLIFVPADIKVCVGDTIKWTNNKAGPHNVIFTEGPAGVDLESLGMGEELLEDEGLTFSQTVTKAGDYKYICSPHGGAGMNGEITVAA
jgi:plastocyanin